MQLLRVRPYWNSFTFSGVLFVAVRAVLYKVSILVAFEALNTFVFNTIIMAGLYIEVEIMKSPTATAAATSSTMWLKSSSIRRFSSVEKCIIRLLFRVLLSPLHIFFNQQSFYILPVEIIGARAFKLVKKLSYNSGKLPNTTNFFDESHVIS